MPELSCAPISAPLIHLATLSYTRTSDKAGLDMRPEGEQEGKTIITVAIIDVFNLIRLY